METRRCVWVSVDRVYVLDWFLLQTSSLPEYALVSRTRGVPPGCKVRGVDYDFLSDCFRFLIEHPSFSEVPDGSPAPRWEGEFGVEHEWVRLEPGPDSPQYVVDADGNAQARPE